MTKANDQERINQLKLRIWGHVARNILNGTKDPYEITQDQIEPHRGRIKKALNDLSGYIQYSRGVKGQYSSETIYYKVLHHDESISLSEVPKFYSDLHNIHNLIFRMDSADNQIAFDTIAYKRTNDLSLSNLLYVYWNKDNFDVLYEENTTALIYPKATLETRTKAILRAIIEQYTYTHYHSWIEKFLGIPIGSMRTDDEIKIKVRNFSAHSYRLSKENFLGQNGYLNEYAHFANYFQALAKSLTTFDQLIMDHGGYDSIIEIYRKETIKHLLEQALLHTFSKKEESKIEFREYFYAEPVEANLRNPFLNTFILKNAQYFDYDILFDTDKSIMIISDDLSTEDKTFKADGYQTAFIEDVLPCTQNNN